MRIISGIWRGRRLLPPAGNHIRPTSDKVRGAVFNALRARGAIECAHVLDLFCGTGALGLEALSQGAEHCVFVDKERDSLALARENAAKMEAGSSCSFVLKQAETYGAKGDKAFSLIFADPPYGSDILAAVFDNLIAKSLIASGGLAVIETAAKAKPDFPAEMTLCDTKTYGDTQIMFVRFVS